MILLREVGEDVAFPDCCERKEEEMRIPLKTITLLSFLVAVQSLTAQQAVPPPLLSPAPLLGIGKDEQGRPIPFGVPPYYSPDTPLGNGPYKAVMATDPGLPEHVFYYPANIDASGKLPIISWGNGGCIHAGNRFRVFLTEIASHGFLVISAGTMGHVSLEVGPQENPEVRKPGAPPAPPTGQPLPNNDPSAAWRSVRSNADHLKKAIDWAIAENGRPGSKFYGKLDAGKVAVAGQSCGGGLAAEAAADPRVTTVAMFNSAVSLSSQPGAQGDPAENKRQAQARLDAFHSPTLVLTGDEALDILYSAGAETFKYLSKAPIFYAWEEKLQHIGTYGFPGGGSIGRIATDWFMWQLKGDSQAARMFQGTDCTLCREPTWHVQKKNMK
jgi:hypothetical protein